MRAVSSRAVVRLSAAGLGAGLLLAGSMGSAGASTTTSFHDLNAAKVLTALPPASALPAGTKLAGKVQVTKAAFAQPCGASGPKVAPTGAAGVAAVYSSGTIAATSSTVSIWTISAAVFATHAEAATAAKTFAEVQAKCPPTLTSGTATLARTVLAPDTSEKGRWRGARAVYHLTATFGKTTVKVRLMTTWFERGNVLVQVSESAPLTANSGAGQDALRKVVTVTTLQRLDAAAA